MSDVDLIINVHTNGIKDITNLSAATRSLAQNLRGVTVPMTKLDAHSKAVNKALGLTNRSMNDHAKSVKQLVANQKALGEETKRVQSNINSYRTAIAMAGGSHTEFGRELIGNQASLIKFGTTLRGLKIRAFGSDLQSVALKMQRIGKDAQFVGRSLMMNLTAPIMLFARLGFQSLLKIDEQLVRLTKVLENVAMNADQARLKLGLMEGVIATPAQTKRINTMVDSFNKLEGALTGLSNKFGVSKDLVIGLSVDFAELGITANENIVSLTEMTLAAEKLGNMDASGAQDLTQALYFNSKRALEASGAMDNLKTAAERETRAIKAAQTQLYMFNTIENVTALSLKDLAQALPEVGSMAVSFGISMTEAAAMLAPMKAAGLDVGASANSIKISLQRVISPTMKTTKLLERLAKQYGVSNDAQSAFNNTTKTGLAGLEAITEVFDKVVNSSAGTEGALKLMSQIFEKRQGPRMLIAIEQLNNFNKELKGLNSTARSQSSEGLMAMTAEKALIKYNQLNNTALPTTINNFRDIGIVARIATATAGQMVEGFKGKGFLGAVTQKDIDTAKQARGEVAKLVSEKKQLEGIDLIGQAKSESGRAMLVELAGASNAQDVANMELEQSLMSLSTTVQKIKNTFKNFAAEILKTVRPAVETIQKKLASLYTMWQGMSDATKATISKTIVGFLALLAVLGPVVLALGTMQASVGVMGRGLAFFMPKLKNAESGFVGLAKGAQKAASALKDVYSNYLNKKLPNTLLPGFASGSGTPASMVGIPQRVGRNITLPGNVRPTPTSLAGLTGPARAAAVASNRAARSAHATAGTFAVDQYMRNETQMLGAKGMRTNAAGRVINARGGFVRGGREILEDVSKASVLREAKLSEAGVFRTPTGEAMLRTRSGATSVSEKQALKVARGGIVGKATRAQVGVRDAVSSIGQAPQKAMQAYAKSVKGAQAAVKALKIEEIALEGGAGKIKTLTTAMGGFMKATKLGDLGLKMMKATLITTGIGIAILAIGVAVMLIVKNFDQFKKAGKGAMTGLMNVWGILKEAFFALIQPIQDLFASFSKGGKDGKSAVGGLAVVFGGLVKVLQIVAKAFKGFVNLIKPYLYMVVNVVAAIVAIFQGDWKKALGYIVAAFAQAGIFLIGIAKAAVKGLVSVFFLFVKGVLTYFTLIPKAFAKIMGFIASHAGPFKGLFQGISDHVNGVVDDMFGFVDAAHNVVNKGIDAVGDTLTKGLKKGANLGIKEGKNELGKGKTTLVNTSKDTGEAMGEAIASGTGDGFDKNNPADAIAGKLKDGINDAVQQLQDYVAGELKNAIEKYVDASVKAFEKQKASALKVFDVQLKTLTKLEKAEESLTKKKEYEVNRRKLLDDKTLSDETYRRNYAMAIYEGRVDDARALQQQQKADQRNLNNDLLAIDDARAKDLAKENLDALKDAINEAKDAASVFFDEAITKFQDSIVEITKFPPVTIEDYRTQIDKIWQITDQTATKNSETFGKMFDTFASTINSKMPNDVVGAFTTNLDDLVKVAQEKYGLGATAGEDTVIGATIGMLADIGGKFGEGKQFVVDKFGEITLGFKDNFKTASAAIVKSVTEDFLTPFAEATTKFKDNWEKIYVQAIKDGNQAITDSLRNNVLINKDLFNEMKGYLDETALKWLNLKAAADAAADAQQNAANGGGGGDTSTPSSGAGTGLNIGRADAYIANNALLVKAGKKPISYTQFTQGAGLTTDAIRATPGPATVIPRPGAPRQTLKKGGIVKRASGGPIPTRQANQNNGYPEGYIPAPTQEGVPALLHGGEYILNAKAVSRLGLGALNKLNNNLIPRFLKGGLVPGGKKGTASNTRGSADRLEQQIVAKSKTKAVATPTGPIDLSSIPGVTWKPLPKTIQQIPGVATVGKSYSSSELKNLNLQPNTFLIPQPSFTSKKTKGGGQEYFTIGNRQQATNYAQVKAQNDFKAAQTAEQEKWTTWERFIGQNTVNGSTTIGGPYQQSDLAHLVEMFPLGAILAKDMAVGMVKSFGRTLSLSNARKWGNFGSEGPGWKERGLYALEDALNIISIAQITKPFVAPGQAMVRNALTEFAIKDAARQFEEQTGKNLISMVNNAGKAAGAGEGIINGGIRNIAVKDSLYTTFKSAAQSKYGMSLEDLLIQSANNLKYKDAVEVALAGGAFETGVKNTTSNILGGRSGLLALNPAKQVKLTMAARGADLSKMIESGVINSSLARESGYIGNNAFLADLGITNEGYSGYNTTRDRMQSISGVLKGNSNYGYARLADDYATAAQYTEFHMNITEAGQLYNNPAGAWKRNVQGELDKMLGGAYINLKPNSAMTYTPGDSYNMFNRRLLTSPAENIPSYLGNMPLVSEYGNKIIEDAAGAYTEIQFPNIPFDSSAIESVELTRNDLMRYYTPPGESTAGAWGSDYLTIAGPQEQLVMQRELARQLSDLGINVKTGVNDAIYGGPNGMTRIINFDSVPLHQLPQDEFDRMLLSISEKIRADQGLSAIPQDVITSSTFNIKSMQDGIRSFIANYRTASSLISMPTESVSSALNASVFDSAGGRLASNLGRIRGGIGGMFGRTTGRLESLDFIPDANLKDSRGLYNAGNIGAYIQQLYSLGINSTTRSSILEDLVGSADMSVNVARGYASPRNYTTQPFFPRTGNVPGIGMASGFIGDPNGISTGIGLTNLQVAAREHILKNVNLAAPQNANLLSDLLSIIQGDMSGSALDSASIQDFAYGLGNYSNINTSTFNDRTPSLWIQAKHAMSDVSLGQLGWNTPENLSLFDDVYQKYFESYINTANTLNTVGFSQYGDEFPLEGVSFPDFSRNFKVALGKVAEMDPNDMIVQLLQMGDTAGAAFELKARVFRNIASEFDIPGNEITSYDILGGYPDTGRLNLRRTISPAHEKSWFFKLKDNASILDEAGLQIPNGNFLSALVNSRIGNMPTSIFSRDAASVTGRRNNGTYPGIFNEFMSNSMAASGSTLNSSNFYDEINDIRDRLGTFHPLNVSRDVMPLSSGIEQYLAGSASQLHPIDRGAGWKLQPSSWTWDDEIKLTQLMENAAGSGSGMSAKFGRGIPLPNEFSDLVKEMWTAHSTAGSPQIDDQAIRNIWENFLSTKDQLFTSGNSYDPIGFNSYMKDKQSGLYRKGIYQSGSPFDLGDLANLGYSNPLTFDNANWIDSRSSTPIIMPRLGSQTKLYGALYQLAGRVIPEIQMQAAKTMSLDALSNSSIANLTPQALLESQDFARYLGAQIPSSTVYESNPDIANILANMTSLKGYKTGNLFSFETPLHSDEYNWWIKLFKNAENKNLNYDLFLPDDPSLSLDYGGLPFGQVGPGGPSTMNPQSVLKSSSTPYMQRKENVADWLKSLVPDIIHDKIASVRVTRTFFDKLIKWYEAPDGVNPNNTGYYSDYFENLTSGGRSSKVEFADLVDLVKQSNSSFPTPELSYAGRFPSSTSYLQNLIAARNLQYARFINTDTVLQFSDNVSEFAQEIAAQFATIAPLAPGGSNSFNPIDDISASTEQRTALEAAEWIAGGGFMSPSAILEEFVRAQMKGSTLASAMQSTTSDKSLLGVNKFIKKYGKMKIKGFKTGGYVPGAPSTAIPAILHGGEYVINSDAVRNMGVRTMQSINQSKFKAPSGAPAYAGGGQTTNVSTVNINVDTFIGEEEWFKGMMKDYNVNVLPRQQKAAGLESRTFTSYNGIQGF